MVQLDLGYSPSLMIKVIGPSSMSH